MKTFVALFLFVVLFSSCINSSNAPTMEDSLGIHTDTVSTAMMEAMSTEEQIFEYIEQADKKEITKTELDIKAKPLQKQVDSITATLSESQSKEFDKYKAQLFLNLADRKAAREKNK